MSVDSANHDDVAGLFKRLGARAGTSQYYDFSDEPAGELPLLGAHADVVAAPAPRDSALGTATAPAAVVSPAGEEALVSPPPVMADVSPLQQLFQRLAQAPLQGAGYSPLSRLRQR